MRSRLVLFPSSTEHEKFCANLPGPPGKAKYFNVTDSELVLRRKGEKYSYVESEIEPETVCLQSVGVPTCRDDSVPFA